MSAPIIPDDVAENVRRALAEDVGAGDLTARLIPADAQAEARVITREEAVLCGTATRAHRYAEAVRGTRAVILDTRKTVPGLRRAQKYAVACGGGRNHRLGLYDAVLIKENHIAAAGSVTAALEAARRAASPGVLVEIEVENPGQLREALAAGADHLLLDNFSVGDLKAAVAETRGRAKLEASGGVDLSGIRAIAETGVDYISVGEMTKSIRAVDLSMRFTHRA